MNLPFENSKEVDHCYYDNIELRFEKEGACIFRTLEYQYHHFGKSSAEQYKVYN